MAAQLASSCYSCATSPLQLGYFQPASLYSLRLRTTPVTSPSSRDQGRFRTVARSGPVPQRHGGDARRLKDDQQSDRLETIPASSSRGGAVRGVAVAGATFLVAMALLQAGEPAMAYIGGGPYGREVTRGQDLTGKDYSGLDLTQQDFKTSILRQANFHGSKLLGASFFDADLTGADLSDADLRGADFSLASAPKANFTNALFEGATVTGNTSFKAAIITGADFTDVLFREDQRKVLCAAASGVNPVTGNETRETLNCP